MRLFQFISVLEVFISNFLQVYSTKFRMMQNCSVLETLRREGCVFFGVAKNVNVYN